MSACKKGVNPGGEMMTDQTRYARLWLAFSITFPGYCFVHRNADSTPPLHVCVYAARIRRALPCIHLDCLTLLTS